MKMMCLKRKKSSDVIALCETHDLALILAKRLDLNEFEITPYEVKFRELRPEEVHGNIVPELDKECLP